MRHTRRGLSKPLDEALHGVALGDEIGIALTEQIRAHREREWMAMRELEKVCTPRSVDPTTLEQQCALRRSELVQLHDHGKLAPCRIDEQIARRQIATRKD